MKKDQSKQINEATRERMLFKTVYITTLSLLFERPNRFLGALAGVILGMPLILLGVALHIAYPLYALWNLQFRSALKELLFLPFRAIFFFIHSVILAGAMNAESGLLSTLSTSFTRLTHFFRTRLYTPPEFILSALSFSEYAIITTNETPPGRLIRKMYALILPHRAYELFESHDASPHHPRRTITMRQGYAQLLDNYGAVVHSANVITSIDAEIKQYIDARIDSSKTDTALSYAYALAAERCFTRLLHLDKPDSLDRDASDVEGVPSMMKALRLIWTSINQSALPEEGKRIKKELMITYLSSIQRGLGRLSTSEDDGLSPDQPECPTGALAILLGVWESFQTRTVVEPSTLDQVDTLRGLLTEKMQQQYAQTQYLNSRYGGTQTMFTFRKDEKRPLIKYYAQFLFHNSTALSQEQINETADATVDAWEPPRNRPLVP